VTTGLLVLSWWFIGMPVFAYRSRISPVTGSAPGPWIADAFLSLFALIVQYAAPTPIAAAFWPSALSGLYLVFSRKDRPSIDMLLGIIASGFALGLGYVLLSGIRLGTG
jgi:hypothetical protein